MNLINTILILTISLVLINHLTNGEIINRIKNCFLTCQTQVEKMTGTNRHSEPNTCHVLDNSLDNSLDNLLDSSLDLKIYQNLYQIINQVVTPNVNLYELSNSRNKKILVNDVIKKSLIDLITEVFNYGKIKFTDIVILNEPFYYYNNPHGKDIEPFNFSANISYKQKPIGSVIINIQCFLQKDNIINSELGLTNAFTILRAHLIKRINSDKPDIIKPNIIKPNTNTPNTTMQLNPNEHIISKIEQQAMDANVELTKKMTNSFNDHFVNRSDCDDLFIKPSSKHQTAEFENDTDLIPSIVNISSYEEQSDLEYKNI